jgi:hypothetical protein
LKLVVEDEHHGGSDRPEGVGTGSLEECRDAFGLGNLAEAIGGALVDPFFLGLLGLHLKATSHRVERVRGVTGGNGGHLCASELGGDSHEALVVLVGVLLAE